MPTAYAQRRLQFPARPLAYGQRARFGNALAALPASLPIDVGGPLVVVDTGGHAATSGGRLQFSGALGSPTQGDPGVWGPAFARKVGRCLLATVNVASIASGTALQVGWDSNQAGAPREGFQFAASGVLSCFPALANGPLVYLYTVGADYQLALVMQTLGCIWLIRGGTEYPDWTLLWVSNADATASLFPAVSGKAGVLSAPQFDVLDLGGPWGVDYGPTAGHIAATANGDTLSGLPPACLIEHTITAATGVTQELSVHRVDDNNRMAVRLSQSGATCKLIEIVAGVETERSSAAQTQTNGTQYRVMVLCDPEHATLRSWVDGVQKNGYTSWAALLTAQGVKVSHAGAHLAAWPRYGFAVVPPRAALAPVPSLPIDYYFSTAGNDANAGQASDAPYLTYVKMNTLPLKGGDRVLINRGETRTTVAGSDFVNFTRDGFDGGYVTYDAYGAGADPILDGDFVTGTLFLASLHHWWQAKNLLVKDSLDGNFRINNSSHWVIEDCESSGAQNDNVYVGVGNATPTPPSHDFRITRLDAHDALGPADHTTLVTGIEIVDGSYNGTLEDSTLHGNEQAGLSMHAHAAPIGTGMPHDLTITGNDIYANGRYGIFLDKIYEGDQLGLAILLDGNTTRDHTSASFGHGIYFLRGAATGLTGGVTISNHICTGNVGYDLHIEYARDILVERFLAGSADGQGVDINECPLVTIRHLTAVVQTKSVPALTVRGGTSSVVLRNSILERDTGTVVVSVAAGAALDADYVCYVVAGGESVLAWSWQGVAMNFAAWKAASGNDAHSIVLTSSPFTNKAGGDFTLANGSACIDAGVDVGLSFNGAAPDLGYAEHA
jgi:hypothetical protein